MPCTRLLLIAIVLASVDVLDGQTPSYPNIGRAPTTQEIQSVSISVGPDGKGLPPGQGTSKEGAVIYAAECAVCHGAEGEGGRIGPRLIGGKADSDSLTTTRPARTIGAYWPFATTIWDYINRTMPRNQGGSLTPHEVYSLTAFILARSGIMSETDVLNAATLPKVRMPNREGFLPQDFSEIPEIRKRKCRQGLCP
jgi:S-disulfanyl-L-cysteine oxidoreductase SoxD